VHFTVLILTVISKVKLIGGGVILRVFCWFVLPDIIGREQPTYTCTWQKSPDFYLIRFFCPSHYHHHTTHTADAACVGLYEHIALCVAVKGLFPVRWAHEWEQCQRWRCWWFQCLKTALATALWQRSVDSMTATSTRVRYLAPTHSARRKIPKKCFWFREQPLLRGSFCF